jgi:hypothetical protein
MEGFGISFFGYVFSIPCSFSSSSSSLIWSVLILGVDFQITNFDSQGGSSKTRKHKGKEARKNHTQELTTRSRRRCSSAPPFHTGSHYSHTARKTRCPVAATATSPLRSRIWRVQRTWRCVGIPGPHGNRRRGRRLVYAGRGQRR